MKARLVGWKVSSYAMAAADGNPLHPDAGTVDINLRGYMICREHTEAIHHQILSIALAMNVLNVFGPDVEPMFGGNFSQTPDMDFAFDLPVPSGYEHITHRIMFVPLDEEWIEVLSTDGVSVGFHITWNTDDSAEVVDHWTKLI